MSKNKEVKQYFDPKKEDKCVKNESNARGNQASKKREKSSGKYDK